MELRSAPLLRLSGEVDSNSPAVWERVAGRNLLFVITSHSGTPRRAWGRDLATLNAARQVALTPWPGGGVWMEAVVRDIDGTWYGYYHNEIPAEVCGRTDKVIPRIGAARSRDRGNNWEDLGIVVEAPPRSYVCNTSNQYFVGGVGDFSVHLDAESRDLYFFYSLYLRTPMSQGVGIARLAWADRDAPVGKITVWRNDAWMPATAVRAPEGEPRWFYPAAMPIFPAAESWHDADRIVDAFWGPSVHWNTQVGRYVMLLNRAKDVGYEQEGVYVSFAPSLTDPRQWTPPVRILKGGNWYPQVLGLDEGSGTDKTAGEWARFFMLGESRHLIRFLR
ncbi:MAG: hypothetical protein A3I61_18410 [Acidobacteria bacterium RIFCSPLOWO2_02_FULL_68_18]|nr:MAG: hypothetical protein A3I61_18410 [Acidobacteria bacterium RIFCSPLOWO2_02_FULL_68_18]OFW48025.1 MAG: hypothetical protein A3G77_11025 [Acidobacteria bacterium RIFCSPLOWO2_12_FULL_68_19]